MILQRTFIYLIISCISLLSSHGQSNTNNMNPSKSEINPLLCDPETGLCEIPQQGTSNQHTHNKPTHEKKIQVIYFTDPICSSCWGIEPQLRKLKLEYGQHIEIEYRMGGLLPDWSYNSGGISKPSDVAHHWDEVSLHYDMPIDGDVWLEDPLDSSYPPSIAFKAAQLQSREKAMSFLREMREMVFLKKKNIAKWEHIAMAAEQVGLDVERLKNDFERKAKVLFAEDLKLAKAYGVRGFPTMFFVNTSGKKDIVYGSRPYDSYEKAILKIQPELAKREYGKDWESLFTKYSSLTAKEFSELSGMPRSDVEQFLNDLTQNGKLEILSTKNGAIWVRKNIP